MKATGNRGSKGRESRDADDERMALDLESMAHCIEAFFIAKCTVSNENVSIINVLIP